MKSVDIMGPLMNILRDEIEEEPYYEPGLVHRLDEAYFNKIEAIEFAVKYDDGKDPKLVDRIGCTVIDVSDKAIEETANDIMNIIDQNDFNELKKDS